MIPFTVLEASSETDPESSSWSECSFQVRVPTVAPLLNARERYAPDVDDDDANDVVDGIENREDDGGSEPSADVPSSVVIVVGGESNRGRCLSETSIIDDSSRTSARRMIRKSSDWNVVIGEGSGRRSSKDSIAYFTPSRDTSPALGESCRQERRKARKSRRSSRERTSLRHSQSDSNIHRSFTSALAEVLHGKENDKGRQKDEEREGEEQHANSVLNSRSNTEQILNARKFSREFP
jgi:hypothetical protein